MILLTGASGRIGKVVLADLLKRGFNVRATTRDLARTGSIVHQNLEWYRFDFATDDDFDRLGSGLITTRSQRRRGRQRP